MKKSRYTQEQIAFALNSWSRTWSLDKHIRQDVLEKKL